MLVSMFSALKSRLKHFSPVYRFVQKASIQWQDHSPFNVQQRRLQQIQRDEVERIFFALGQGGKPVLPEGAVLVDAMWDNPNYWLRFSLLRKALGLSGNCEVGLLGEYAAGKCRRTLKALGINTRLSFQDFMPPQRDLRTLARDLIRQTKTAADILQWRLPHDVPGMILYDALLKQQRVATVNIHSADFERQVTHALQCIEAGNQILNNHDFKMVVLSHNIDVVWGALAWQALSRGIPMVMPFGLFGVLRFTHMTRPEDLFSFYDRPTRNEIDDLPPHRAAAMEAAGQQYLERRYAGFADDLASVYAYRNRSNMINRADICDLFNWDPNKPIVAFYASNWFDWPHQLGMTQFTDFLDWVETSLEAAKANQDVNWLFKPHPCEDWFGGVSLTEMMQSLASGSHIKIADKSWNNAAVMESVDALVTYHGTAGIEFAAMGKPVLVPDKGKYEDCGFVRLASCREDYLTLLRQPWWEGMNMEQTKKRAKTFCGWWFCAPDWQGNFILQDDSRQWDLYDSLPDLIANGESTITREINMLREWYENGHSYYHTYKMKQSDAFILTNV